jgi:hypothetical protein
MIAEIVEQPGALRRLPASPRVRFGWVLPVATALGIVIVRMRQLGDYPTGPDGGTWLALGRGLLGGSGRETPGAYSPLVPVVVAAAAQAFGPVLAVWVVAAATWTALLGALALVAWRSAQPAAATMLVLAVGGSSAMSEPLFFGGYPQIAATAALVITVWFFASWLLDGRFGAAVAGGFALLVAAASHHVFGPLAVAAVGVLVLAWVGVSRPVHRTAMMRAIPVAGAGIVAAVLLGKTWSSMCTAGYAPPLEAAAFTVLEAWTYATRENAAVWTVALVIGGMSLWSRRHRAHPAWLAAVSLLAVFVPAMLAFAEPRLATPILIGIGLALLLLVERSRSRGPAGALVIAALVIVIAGHRTAGEYARFYMVLDRSTLAAAAAVESASPVGIVAVRADRRGWPVGWWFEGLTTAPIAVGSDPRWLGYPDERAAAAMVADLFASGATPWELRARADRHRVDLLVSRKWEWIGWERWLSASEPPVEVVFDDDITIVLRILLEADRPRPGRTPGV